MRGLTVDPANVARFIIRVTGTSKAVEDTRATWTSGNDRRVTDSKGSIERLAVHIEGGRPFPPSWSLLKVWKSKLTRRGWLWIHHRNTASRFTLSYWARALANSERLMKRALNAAGFPAVRSFSIVERGPSTKSCLWIVPLDTARFVVPAGAALGLVTPWKIALAQRPAFWKYFVSNRAYVASSSITDPPWLTGIRDDIECFYTTRWRIAVWYRQSGRLMVREVFFPIETTHDNLRRFWQVLESVPPGDRERLGLADYSLSSGGNLVWIDRPLLQPVAADRNGHGEGHDEDVVSLVRMLHHISPRGPTRVSSLKDVVDTIVKSVEPPSTASRREIDRVKQFAAELGHRISGPPVLHHGDLVKGNVVATANGLKAFDWWAAEWVDFPGHDLLCFYYSEHADPTARREHIQEVVRRLVDDTPDRTLVQKLRRVRSDLDWRSVKSAYVLLLLARSIRGDTPSKLDDWIATVVTPTLDSLERVTISRVA